MDKKPLEHLTYWEYQKLVRKNVFKKRFRKVIIRDFLLFLGIVFVNGFVFYKITKGEIEILNPTGIISIAFITFATLYLLYFTLERVSIYNEQQKNITNLPFSNSNSQNKSVHKIIYFDKETIRNILEKKNKGAKISQKDISKTTDTSGEIGTELKVNLGIPVWERFNFLFSGNLKTSFMTKHDSSTSITSTEISEFESIKDHFSVIENTLIHDIENSSTFFRVAGAYLRIVQGGIEGVDTKEFKAVMDSQDGYDTYKIDNTRYVRFNNTAFLSNYKRNDLLATKMTIYCIPIGKFDKDKFDFMKQLNKMQTLFTDDHNQTLEDVIPSRSSHNPKPSTSKVEQNISNEKVDLFDVVYASVSTGDISD